MLYRREFKVLKIILLVINNSVYAQMIVVMNQEFRATALGASSSSVE